MSLKTASVKQVKGALPHKERFREETPIEGYLSKAVSDVCGWVLRIIIIIISKILGKRLNERKDLTLEVCPQHHTSSLLLTCTFKIKINNCYNKDPLVYCKYITNNKLRHLYWNKRFKSTVFLVPFLLYWI